MSGTRGWRGAAFPLAYALTAVGACGGNANVDRQTTPYDSTALATNEGTSVRFAIELSASASGPFYVSLSDADAQPGWVRAFRGGQRIFLLPRCDIEDCGAPPAVCGAALPVVLDLASVPDRSIEFVWDGMTSVIDTVTGCETRQMALQGEYLARFCYSSEAELDSVGDPARPSPGRLVRPQCVEISFGLADREVVLRM